MNNKKLAFINNKKAQHMQKSNNKINESAVIWVLEFET